MEVEGQPVWEESTGRFWCTTSLNAYDIPDGIEWNKQFQEIVERTIEAGAKKAAKNPLQRHASDSTPRPPTPQAAQAGRLLARFPSDPDKRMARSVHTTALLQMPHRAGRLACVQGHHLAFFRFEGRLFATDAHCPHQGGQLCEGEVGDIEDMVEGQRSYVTCPVHKMKFDLSTGEVIEGSCPPLKTYAVRIREADDVRRIAMVEVGFESLAANYFGGEGMDLDL